MDTEKTVQPRRLRTDIEPPREERLDHLRQIIEELAKRIEAAPNVIVDKKKEAAVKHGQERYEQGYTVGRMRQRPASSISSSLGFYTNTSFRLT